MALQIIERRPKENNCEYAYRILRGNIMNFWLEPGVTLNETELCALFGMSRTPIREAIMKLRGEHLVEVVPQQGTTISRIDLSLLRQGHFIRLCVEPHIVEELAGRLEPENLKTMQLILQKQAEAQQASNPIETFFTMDDRFHEEMYILSKKPNVWGTIKSLSSHFDRVRYLDAMYYRDHQLDYLHHFLEEHRKLYEILLCGIAPGFDVTEFLEKHISSYRKCFLPLTELYPHYFKGL